ncbi:MAG: Histidine kinase, partial [Thermodesulfobacteriota bacterium]|nr:Histidine kinase [Thermodesulfobacteriota bacterium]
ILRTLFADRAGAVTVTSSYKESLRLLQDANVNLVIADHDAFRKDTGRITRRIKELRPDLSVVLINTQRASDSRTTRGSTDADLTIPRPLNLNRFLSQVAMLMGEGAPE